MGERMASRKSVESYRGSTIGVWLGFQLLLHQTAELRRDEPGG